MSTPARLASVCALLLAVCPTSVHAADPDEVELASRFESDVRVIVAEHCNECHSQKLAEADIDLTSFKTLGDVQHDLVVWQKVAEMLDSNQMPPKDSKQLADEQRTALREWLNQLLTLEALRTAGDPGPVVLRRLNNAEYTYVLRDLTGVANLEPAKEFPADGAAGEGFTNAGNALSMSPALLSKYLDAAKEVASHAVLLPDGIRFSPSPTRRDWTEELLADIRQMYAKYSAKVGATQVNLQGEVFDTNNGGRLPIDLYLAATIEERDAISTKAKTIAEVAAARGLSPKYLQLLWDQLSTDSNSPSLLLDELRSQWTKAKPADLSMLTAIVSKWQSTLWRFSSVGHIGKVNGPKAWLEPTDPIVSRQELRLKIPKAEPGRDITLYMVAGDAGDGNEHDFAVWERPRLVAPGRPDLLLKDVQRVATELQHRRDRIFADASKSLAAAAEVSGSNEAVELVALAEKHSVSMSSLRAWFDYLGIGTSGPVKVNGLLSKTITSVSGYDFVQGWIGDDALSVLANSSDQAVRVPGNMKPRCIAVHPSPTQQIAVGWKANANATVQIAGAVQHAHPECGNGVSWALELRHGNTRQRLAVGTSQGALGEKFAHSVSVQAGDVVALVIGPRDANHSCDLTAIELTIKDEQHTWSLAEDIAPNILASNPHADHYGNKETWHFYSEPTQGTSDHVIPAQSLLAQWQATSDRSERTRLAAELQKLLSSDSQPPAQDSPDLTLLQQLKSLSGPLLSATLQELLAGPASETSTDSPLGLDPKLFGVHPRGGDVEAGSLCVQAPKIIEVKLPSDLVAGSEFVTAGSLHPTGQAHGSVQFELLTEKPQTASGLQSIAVTEQVKNGAWTSNNRSVAMSSPIVAAEGSDARKNLVTAFNDFRNLFPTALCYTKIVPVDEVVTLTLYYREDEMLQRLMLSEDEINQLNRLWSQLHFVSQDALLSVDAYEQLWQYATQDADPSAFEPLREPLMQRAAAFRNELVAAEPAHVNAVLRLAQQAYRRPLRDDEQDTLRKLYADLRNDELPHDAAVRMLLARVLISPAFLYRTEVGDLSVAVANTSGSIPSRPVTDRELATRLSFFLWSTYPDERLQTLADEGRLHEPEVLLAETRRMLKDERVRRMATEFTCQWIQIYDFAAHDEKSEITFPTFNALRESMYEEAIRYFTDLYQRDGSVLELIDSDHTFINRPLAEHYAIESAADDWHRVDGVRTKGRGGILGMAATLSKQAGASRTSPILRGNWISEVLIGEKLPKPPKNVPVLPESVPNGLTERQLIEQHSSDPACAKCHARIDPFGFSLENFDGVGRFRSGPEINSLTALADGTELAGYEGLKSYLLNQRRSDFVRQFCKKSLGYALGRAVQLSDEPLIAEMQQRLVANNYRISSAIEAIVTSPQFQRIRTE